MTEIGQRIAGLRKEAHLTQEQLGEAVGVSGQAVSKWENGGVPDTVLLPQIAQVLGVSIDALFGRERAVEEHTDGEICTLLFRYVRKRCRQRGTDWAFFAFLFEAIWSMQSGYFAPEELIPLSEVTARHGHMPQITSQILDDQGTTYLTLMKDFPFFCAVKDTDTVTETLLSETDFDGLFALLANEDGRRAILFTQQATETNQYTADAMADKLGIDRGKFQTILPSLLRWGLLHEDTLTLDEKEIRIYHKWSNPEIRPLLIMAYQFIHARQCYYNFTSNRTKPYL